MKKSLLLIAFSALSFGLFAGGFQDGFWRSETTTSSEVKSSTAILSPSKKVTIRSTVEIFNANNSDSHARVCVGTVKSGSDVSDYSVNWIGELAVQAGGYPSGTLVYGGVSLQEYNTQISISTLYITQQIVLRNEIGGRPNTNAWTRVEIMW